MAKLVFSTVIKTMVPTYDLNILVVQLDRSIRRASRGKGGQPRARDIRYNKSQHNIQVLAGLLDQEQGCEQYNNNIEPKDH